MKPSAQLLQPLLDTLKNHSSKTTLVGIDGYPGIGKTTLAEELKSRGTTVLHQDDHLLSLKERLRLIENSQDLDTTIIFDFYDSGALQASVREFKQRSRPGDILVVEGVFVLDTYRNPEGWDVSVYLSSDDLDAIDARRIVREKKRWGDLYMSEDDPRSLFPKITKAYRSWATRVCPERYADLVLGVD